jgi:uncharacterized protein
VKLLLQERGTDETRDLYFTATRVFSSRLLVPEASAALGRAARSGRIGTRATTKARELAELLLRQVVPVEVDPAVAARAWDLAAAFPLRGYDAVHLASFERVEVGDAVFVAADSALAGAAASLGHAVAVPGA